MDNKRVYAIDVLRALTLVLMIFVNDIPGMQNIPAWLNHMPAGVDALGLADIVFPLFLFVVGMSIPLAIEHRRKKGDDTQKILVHIFTRTFALIAIGMIRVNVPHVNSELTGIPQYLWAQLAYLCVFLVWNVYPKSDTAPERVYRYMKIAGVVGLLGLVFVFRSGSIGNEEYLQPRWWGILGQIGWCYLIGSMVYLFVGKHIGKVSLILLLIAGYHVFAMLFATDYLVFTILPGRGSLVVMAISGMLVSLIFGNYKSQEKKLFVILSMVGAVFFVLCYAIRPIWGISKLDNTPSWIYICIAIGVWGFALIYWLVDLKGIKKWTLPIEPAGANALTAYLMSDLFYYFTWYWGWGYPDFLNSGMLGLVRSILFVFLVLYVVKGLSKVNIRLKL